jgi:F-type H+-transporting ATPase subunit b
VKVVTKLKRFWMLAAMALVLAAPIVSTPARAMTLVSLQGPQAPDAGGRKSQPEAAVPEKKEQEQDESEQYRHSAAVQMMGRWFHLNTNQAATAFEVFNFVLLAIGVGFVALKMLPKLFRTRSEAIQKDLVNARSVTEEASSRMTAVESRLARLDEQIAAMRKQAEADSAADEKRILASVEDEKAKIVEAAEHEIVTATTQARRDLQQYAAELAISQAARKLVVTAETDRLLVEGFAHRLGADLGGQN